jgi:hypothetical protein
MGELFEQWGYRLCWRGDWIGGLWSRFWFRWYCPHPVIANRSAHACIRAGYCGCSNSVHARSA